MQQALAPGTSSFECRHRRPDGRAWLAELRVVRLEPGPPRRLLCALQDVTEQREGTIELRRFEQRYTLAARIGRVAAWELWPVEGRVFYDASLSRLMGYEPEDLGPHLSDWRETIPEAARPAVRAALEAVVEGRSDSYAVEHPVRRKDGSIGWMHVQGERVSAPGEAPLRVVGSTVDITERKRFERDLELTQFAVDHSPNATFWIDDTGRVVRANQRAGLNLGLRACEAFRHTRSCARNSAARRCKCSPWPEPWLCFAPGSTPFRPPARARRNTSQALSPQALRGRPIWSFDPDFGAQDWAPLMQRLPHEGSVVFESRHQRADGSVFPVEITASRIPFEGKAYGLCVVRDISERKRAERALRQARDEAERANRAESEFLSRMSHELRTPLNAILGFGHLLELRSTDPTQGAHGREILNAGQHLLTLVDEVLDLARVESGRLPVNPEPVAVYPLMRDCMARLFVPFERLDADARQLQGTGIGLALSQRLVGLMDGRIGVDSTPGCGSSFWVRLPLAPPLAEPA